MNFKYFQIQKWILQTCSTEKVDETNGLIYVVFMFVSWFIILKLSKKCIFPILCRPEPKNMYIKMYMHLNGLVRCFQKMVLFIMLWLNVFKILVFEIEFC